MCPAAFFYSTSSTRHVVQWCQNMYKGHFFSMENSKCWHKLLFWYACQQFYFRCLHHIGFVIYGLRRKKKIPEGEWQLDQWQRASSGCSTCPPWFSGAHVWAEILTKTLVSVSNTCCGSPDAINRICQPKWLLCSHCFLNYFLKTQELHQAWTISDSSMFALRLDLSGSLLSLQMYHLTNAESSLSGGAAKAAETKGIQRTGWL